MLINIHDAKTHFSKFINQALKGDEIIIARGGKPLIRLVPYTEETETRRGGQFRGLIHVSDDFNAPLPEDVLKHFYGDEK
ncbi:MAG: type II toxin-antitoxin system prevent-host-death family antitoxin [Gammaproteobacteria bacterium]|nr:MAG: type II toxin-antitoxin system prevent-host-death family antitoxin [Gammaproteobacteria bacterium]